jgi:hypothetical protein
MPQPVKYNKCTHKVVNHFLGSVNSEGEHTNCIDSLWAGIKSEIQNSRVVQHDF